MRRHLVPTPEPAAARPATLRHEHRARGQASILVVGGLAGLLIATVIVAAVATAVGREAAAQRAADLAAVATAKVMHANYPRLFEPAYIEEPPNPHHLTKAEYLELARNAARDVAEANGARETKDQLPRRGHDRARSGARRGRRDGAGGGGRAAPRRSRSTSTPRPSSHRPRRLSFAEGGGYSGPLAHRQGVPMRPDVAPAFDRMEAAARADGVTLTITSGYPLGRRAGDPVGAPPGSEVGRPPRHVAAPQRHRTRPRPARRVRMAGGERAAVSLRQALQLGALALRLRDEHRVEPDRHRRRQGGADVARRGTRTSSPSASRRSCATRRSAGTCPRSCSRRSSTPSRASTRSRSRGRARRASRSSCRPRRGRSGSRTRSTPSRRSTRRRGSCATCCASSARFRSRWRRTTPGRERSPPAAACRTPETRGYVARIIGLMNGRGRADRPGGGGLEVRLVR